MATEPTKPDAAAPAPKVEPAAPAAPIQPTEPIIQQDPKDKAEMERLQKENADLKFDKELGEVGKTYPKASDYAAKIKEKVAKGYSTTDAALIVLHENNALQTQPAAPSRPAGQGFGGSMDNPPPRDQADPEPGSPGSADFYAKRFKELEAKGEILID